MKRLACLLIVVLLGMVVLPTRASAEEPYDVTIRADLVQSSYYLSGLVTVDFEDINLYHDQVKLSWHIYDKAGNELLFENERHPLQVKNGHAEIPLNIRLPDVGVDEMRIRFDLVDEKNVFWFGSHPDLRMNTNEIAAISKKIVVNIAADFPTKITDRKIDGNITVSFEDEILYHNQVKLSWHIYNADGTELLFENERLVLPELHNGTCVVPVSIVLNTIEATEFLVRFDLVDEKNAFWFSQNGQIDLRSVDTVYQYSIFTETANVCVNAVRKQPLILVANLLIDVCLVVGLIKIRKRRGKYIA